MNNLYHIIDEGTKDVLFNFRPVQKKLFENLHDSNIILKSRQHGVTTFFCILGLDAALHNSNIRVGIIAHNREDAERFFRDKVKYAWDRLDPGYKQKLAVVAEQSSARELTFSNNSSIRVGTSLRSSTLNILHISEFAKVCARHPEKAREIVTGALNTIHDGALVSIESTAEGREGYFAEYCQQAQKRQQQGKKLSRLDFKFHFFAWWEDKKNVLKQDVLIPARLETYFKSLQEKEGITLTKNQKAWYVKKDAVLGEDMFREHPSTPEESFRSSVEGAYFKSQFTDIYTDSRITLVPYEKGVVVDTAWDLGMADTTPIWFFQRIGKEVRFIDFYENSGEGLAHYAKILREKKYEYGQHFAPHDISVRELTTGKSRLEAAIEMGIRFTAVDRLSKADQIEAGRRLLGRSWFDEKKCEQGILALENYRKAWDEKNGCWKSQPMHNWASHPADSFMVAAIAMPKTELLSTKNKVNSFIHKNRNLRRVMR